MSIIVLISEELDANDVEDRLRYLHKGKTIESFPGLGKINARVTWLRTLGITIDGPLLSKNVWNHVSTIVKTSYW